MTMMVDGFLRDSNVSSVDLVAGGTLLDDLFTQSKNTTHLQGCSCSACHDIDDDKFYLPGGGDVATRDNIDDSVDTTAFLREGRGTGSYIDTANDSDWFRVFVPHVFSRADPRTIIFTVTLPPGGLSDSILTLRDENGDVVATNDDANTSAGLYYSEIRFDAYFNGGQYYLDVSSFGSATGQYRLSMSALVDDEYLSETTTEGVLEIGGDAIVSELSETGDRDWFAVTLEAGEIYEFSTSATGGSNDFDTTLTLRDEDGNVLAFNDDAVDDYSRIRFSATTSGTYFIDVAGWNESGEGDYQLTGVIAPPLQEFTNDQIADQLLSGYWGGEGAERRFDVELGGTISVNIADLTADGQFLAREALNLWADVLGISFNEVTTGGQIVFDDDEDGAFATSERSGNFITRADVNVSTDWLANSGTTLDSYSFQTYIHEIGHALGLGHGGNYNSSADYQQDASYLNDSWATTVMSYFDQTENSFFAAQNFSRVFVISPRDGDIAAIQQAYGVATTTRTGDDTYGVGNTTGRDIYGTGANVTNNSGQLLAFTIIDHGGEDTLDYSSFSAVQVINLNTETFSSVGGSIGNMSIARGTVIENAIGGTGNDELIGNDVGNELTGGAGTDSLDGGSNVDTAIVSGNQSAYTVTQTSTGVFQVVGTDGADILTNIEFLQFDDGTMRLLHGTGVSVNFETADPSVYQSAMDNIQDFDGNDVGGQGNWLRIGSADVNGDGDIDQILVNDSIARFATVGTAEDGLIYYDDHGWAGETRVAGIYIDPLVASGQVEAGSGSDSQTRFQNDLAIENINRVLGADDYDGDGLQEVYFALTDGTAYLHAYMHADGNIQYANYQSQQEVIDFLTANGFDSSTYADWFPSGAEAVAEVESVDKNEPETSVVGGQPDRIHEFANDVWVTGFAEPNGLEVAQLQFVEAFA